MKRGRLDYALKTFAKTLRDILCCNRSRERDNVNVASALKESGLIWSACDAGLLLKDRPEDDEIYTQSGTLIFNFISILFKSLTGRKEHQFRNQDPLRSGFLRHSELLHLSAHIHPHAAEYLFQSSATLLRQLNMTFDPDAEALDSYLANNQSRVSQGNAFLRFADCVEQHLLRHDRGSDRVGSEQTHQDGDVRVSNTWETSLSARMSQVKLSDANDGGAVAGNIVIGNDMHKMLVPERIWRNASQMRSE